MTEKATDELAESVSLEAAHSAREALIPAAVGEAMHTASNQIIQSNLATDVQVAMAATPTSHKLEEAVEKAVTEAATNAVHTVVTSEVASMVRAAVDRAMAISQGTSTYLSINYIYKTPLKS